MSTQQSEPAQKKNKQNGNKALTKVEGEMFRTIHQKSTTPEETNYMHNQSKDSSDTPIDEDEDAFWVDVVLAIPLTFPENVKFITDPDQLVKSILNAPKLSTIYPESKTNITIGELCTDTDIPTLCVYW